MRAHTCNSVARKRGFSRLRLLTLRALAFALVGGAWLAPLEAAAAPGGRVGSASSYHSSSHSSGSSYHGGSSFRPSSTSHGMHAAHGASSSSHSAVRCAHGGDCSEDWEVALGLGLMLLCAGGIGFVFYRSRKATSLSVVSLLVAVGPAGESIKTDFARLAKRARTKRLGDLKRLAQQACTLLGEYRETFTHAGALDADAVADGAAFAQLSNGVWARDAERADYPGVPTYTLVALLFALREAPPPPLSGSTHADVADYLRRLAQLAPQELELMWLPSADRCMTLQELFDRYPELSPLSAGAQARSA